MNTQQRTDDRSGDLPYVERIRDRIADLLEPSTTVETAWVAAHTVPCPEPAKDPGCDRCGHAESAHAASPDDDRCSIAACSCREFVPVPVYRWQERCTLCGLVLERGQGRRLVPRPERSEHPPLLTQLEQWVGGTVGESTVSGSFESKPAARLDAMDTLRTVVVESARLVSYVLHERPASTAANLRVLADHAHELAPAELRDLHAIVRGWWVRARVTAGWQSQPMRPHVRCMVCDAVGTLRVVTSPQAAWCSACNSTWDEATIGILGEHIRLATAEAITPPAAATERAACHLELDPIDGAKELGLPTSEHIVDVAAWRAGIAARRRGRAS